jgi:hypothetical protein
LWDSMAWSIDGIINDEDNIMVLKSSIISNCMSYIKRIDMVSDRLIRTWYRTIKGIEKAFYKLLCLLLLIVYCYWRNNRLIRYYLLKTGLDQIDEWYSWCGLQGTFDLMPYYELDFLYVLYSHALVLVLVLNGVG